MKKNGNMCITPSFVLDAGMVACRHCWLCRKNRVNDYVGRCLAEQATSTKTVAITLTYADDTPNATTLIYKDFQDFMKRLRYHGYSVRYIVAGEYGSKKGRSHWHAVLFFDGKVPVEVDHWDIATSLNRNTPDWRAAHFTEKYCLEERFFWKYWPHGFVYFQRPEYAGYYYLLKYALKEQEGDVSLNHVSMSKKPPLGFKWFEDYAQRYVDQGLAPQDLKYSFPHVFDAKRRRREFMLQGRMREIFIDTYLAKWRDQRSDEPPISEIVELREDEIVRNSREYTIEEIEAMISEWKFLIPKPHTPPADAFWSDEDKEFVFQDIELYLVIPGTEHLIVRYEGGRVAIVQMEGDEWPVRNPQELERILSAFGVDPLLSRDAVSKSFPDWNDCAS
ncbi:MULTISPECIES: hypothetical protein [unclassified Phaeobacter]|uniref:rolling circle replication-associated protein n=2 Tax=Phaeobacter TaxID=302485 RepID=UPI003A89973A